MRSERWLPAVWPVVRALLPGPPARVIELGCGSVGGLVPRLRAEGYDALGVDPEAPEGADYVRAPFEDAELPPAAAVVAVTSLHHVGEPRAIVERIASVLVPGGTLIVVEWAWEDFDDATAAWCFERLGPDGEQTWLHRRRDDWRHSALPWVEYLRDWAGREGIHAAATLVDLLEERFERDHLVRGPYAFTALAATSEAAEQAAIDAGAIRATRVDWAGRIHG